jgi:hypothetical protein
MTPPDIAVRARALLTRSRLPAGAVAALAVATVSRDPRWHSPRHLARESDHQPPDQRGFYRK